MALDYVIIGKRLRDARIRKNLTQEKVSEMLGVSVAFLSRIERGYSHINLNRLNELCHILEISEGYVLTGASSNSTAYLDSEFSNLLKSCSPEKQKLIYDIAKVIVDS